MAGQVSILDDNFVVNDVNGISRWTCVVKGANDNECQNAGAAGAGGFLGIAQEDKDNNLTANIRMIGNTFVKATGAINYGDRLVIGGTNGYVNADYNVPGAQQIVGIALGTAAAAGDLILMAIVPAPKAKQITGTTNATAGTQDSFPHGLGYTPSTVLVTPKGNGVVYESAAADATNIYLSGSAASVPFAAYVE